MIARETKPRQEVESSDEESRSRTCFGGFPVINC